jgi:hypothetical protein
MKKKLLTLLPLLLVPFTINACNSNKTSLTYGTYIESDPSSLKELSCTELKNKATEDKEVFLRDLLKPAQIQSIKFEDKKAIIKVDEEQKPVAIGKKASNIKLASQSM